MNYSSRHSLGLILKQICKPIEPNLCFWIQYAVYNLLQCILTKYAYPYSTRIFNIRNSVEIPVISNHVLITPNLSDRSVELGCELTRAERVAGGAVRVDAGPSRQGVHAATEIGTRRSPPRSWRTGAPAAWCRRECEFDVLRSGQTCSQEEYVDCRSYGSEVFHSSYTSCPAS